MHVSLDRSGRIVQAGEGTFRVPMGADEVDNTLSSPVSQAETLAHRERVEYATMAARAHRRAMGQAQADAHEAYLQNLASSYEEWATEEETAANGGENPLLYLAAMQTMAGGMTENYSPISGYLLSQDGEIDYPRAMSGNVMRSMGQDVQNLIQSAQSAAQQGQALVQAVTGGSGQPLNAAPAPSGAPAPTGGIVSTILTPSKQVAGINVPYPYLLGIVAAYLILRK
jgi:hypothetical protein